MGYQQYGISNELVEEVKQRLKDPVLKARVQEILAGVTKQQLQNRAEVKRLLTAISSVIGVKISPTQAAKIVQFVIDQKIDPNNMFHLIKLWSMFR